MARSTLRAAGLAAVLAGAAADTSCFLEGKEYVDGALTAGMPNGAFVREPYQCQEACQQQEATLGCVGFTWKGTAARATALRGVIGPGGCWLVSSKAMLIDVNATEHPGRIVSGTAKCGEETTAAPTTSEAVATEAPTLPPMPTLPPLVTMAPAPEVNASENTTNATAAAEGASSSGGHGISPWLIMVSVVAVLGITSGVCFLMCSGSGKKASKKSKKDKKTRGIELAANTQHVETPSDNAPLLASSEAAVAAMPAMVAPAVPVTPAMPVMPAMQAASVMSMPGGVYSVQQQGVYSVVMPAGAVYTAQPVSY